MALSRSSKGFLSVLVLLGVVVGVAVLTVGGFGGEPVNEGEEIEVTVPEGAQAADVGSLLADEGVISSGFSFRLSARFDDRSSDIKAGDYTFVAGASTGEILEKLSKGPPGPETYSVTIPEGLTVDQTLQTIAEASPLERDALRSALSEVELPSWVPPVSQLPSDKEVFERYAGLLFPDTYEFTVNESPKQVLSRLVRETDSVVTGLEPPNDLSRYQVLTVASLIEREAKLPRERPKMAAVLYNRLAQPQRLQIDATVQYATGKRGERVLEEDLKVQSPWNTYQRDGLPPTPIASPGRSAIAGAANPAATDARYYVVCNTETGEHAFAPNLQAHNRNVQQFRQIQDSGGSFCGE
jgi:UPF0755 protein